MKFALVFALCLAVAFSAPLDDSKTAVITTYENDNIGVEGYKFKVDTSDGISRAEQGELKNIGTENEAISVQGQYSYTDPEGVVRTVTYEADENGYRPQVTP